MVIFIVYIIYSVYIYMYMLQHITYTYMIIPTGLMFPPRLSTFQLSGPPPEA